MCLLAFSPDFFFRGTSSRLVSFQPGMARGRKADLGGVSVGSLGVSMHPLGGFGGGSISITEGRLDRLLGGELPGGLFGRVCVLVEDWLPADASLNLVFVCGCRWPPGLECGECFRTGIFDCLYCGEVGGFVLVGLD